MDLTYLQEKFHDQLEELRTIKDSWAQYQAITETVITLAYNNKQYSQKNNIKFLGWKDWGKENLGRICVLFCERRWAWTLTPFIYCRYIRSQERIKKNRGQSSLNLRTRKQRWRSVRKYQRKRWKKLLIIDHITQMNSKILNKLNNNDRTKVHGTTIEESLASTWKMFVISLKH